MQNNNGRQTVLVVDDSPDNIDVLAGILASAYNVKATKSGAKAIDLAIRFKPDIILLDIMMPDMDGYEVCARLKEDFRARGIPVIFITAMENENDEARGLALGAVDYIRKPVSPSIVLARVKTHLALYDQNRALELMVRERTAELQDSRLEIIRMLGRAAEFRDSCTARHVIRMSYYCEVLARAAGLSDVEANLILQATPMHDVGKIGIPDTILLKPARLTPEERECMKKHAAFGAKILGRHDTPLLRLAREVALSHHEKWDGSGYPRGLAGEDIPLAGRIVAIADVFDALTSRRPYKAPWPEQEAVAYLREQSGKHFDPALVAAFLDHLDEILAFMRMYTDTN
ncbi:response regulator receiver modulated metal dependent phosphohydrolase [Solidesulfovibrio fructosivorans JJ]]|uniref:Response regulator receiver modulated metal dependent phosphohydrolase n=1 Tax=Solidesulfovibrio fructosivorans JJ] TaxID=596151 RepID=E1JTI0_SOLFR|nr:two-component system response regulator [Solidesulfovibrio fructosivorans]EFL52440.1 response regulator receiver modulated metal dependent phosphohydrolase [Solidesulfovibrio fructosivorans JJ]]